MNTTARRKTGTFIGLISRGAWFDSTARVLVLVVVALTLVGCVVAVAPATPPPSHRVTIPAASPASRTTICGAGKCGESWVEVPEIVPSAASR